MKNHTIKSVTFALGLVLFAGVNAAAATYSETFATGNHNDPVGGGAYGFTQLGDGSNHVRFGMPIDTFGLGLFGGGAWTKWNLVGIDTGVASEPGKITVFACDASVCPVADGPGGNGSTSHWGYFGVRDTVAWDSRVQWTVNDANVGQGNNGWYFDPDYLSPGVGQVHVPGFMGTWDATNGKQERIVNLGIWIDGINNEVWGTISDGTSSHTTAKYPITQNGTGIDSIITGSLTANTGAQTSEGIDIDNIKAYALNLPLEFSSSAVEDTPGVQIQSESNECYRLEYAVPPASNTWFDTGAKVTGDGNLMTLFDPSGPSTTRVYRVMLDL
jgi:hypothetical protein